MGKKRFIKTVVLSILTIFFFTACLYCAEKEKDEQEFKAIVTETNSYFSKSEELMQKLPSNTYEEEMKEQQPKLNALITRLRQFTINYPASGYTDDAAYILTLFWMHTPEKYLQESRLFLEKYPKASLEPLTLNTVQILNPFAKETGVITALKMDISQTLYHLRRYQESAKETRAVIDDLNTKELSDKGYRILGLNYFCLMKDYVALAKNEEVRKVCEEAIAKLPNVKDRESFVKKLKELDNSLK